MLEVTRNNVVTYRKCRVGTIERNNNGEFTCRDVRGKSTTTTNYPDAMRWFTTTDWRTVVTTGQSSGHNKPRRVVRQQQAQRWAIN